MTNTVAKSNSAGISGRQNGESGEGFDFGEGEEGFKPLSREEAAKLRQSHPPLSLWRIVRIQALVAALVAGVAWWLTGRSNMAFSAAYGGLSVVVPAAMFARALSRQAGRAGGAVLAGFAVWELAKLGLTLAMLLLAPQVVMNLSWLALVAGFVVTMKVYWLAMWFALAPASTVKNT